MKQEDEARQEMLFPFLENKLTNIQSLIQTDQHRLHQYSSFFESNDLTTSKTIEHDFISRLPPDITYNSEQFATQILITITRHSKNYQFIDLEVRLGHFTFSRVSIIHINTASPVHDVLFCGNGAFCTVYRCEFEGNILAFKCFSHQRIKCQDNSTSILEKVIEQYCLLRIASCLGAGPKMFNFFGFDIMIHPGCIQICMECCDPFPPNYMSKINEYEQQLKQHLLTLHKLHIIHHDIKMENICFSLAFNSLVFIDFGMSRIVKEELGYKSLTKYRGTLSHCGDEMTLLFQKSSNHKQNVDLYYHDMIGLKKTFENIRHEQFKHDIALISRIRKENDIFLKNVTAFYRIYFIKHLIFLGLYSSQSLQVLDQQSLVSLLNFVPSLYFSSYTKRLLQQIRKITQVNKIFEEENDLSLVKFSNYTIKPLQDDHLLLQSKAQTLNNLKKISIRDIIGYFLNGSARFDQLLDFLTTTEGAASISLEDYLCLLAKAIQINASTLKLAQLNALCLVAQRKSEQFYDLRFNTKYAHQQSPYFFLASEFLFKTAFKHQLKGKYFSIYSSVLNNIFAFNIFSNAQLLQYYDTLIHLSLSLENKILAVIRFHSGLVWMYINDSNYESYQMLRQKIELKHINYLETSPFQNPSEVQFFRNIISFDQTPKDNLHSVSEIVLSKSTQLELRMWLVFKKLQKMQFNIVIEEQINIIQSELQFQRRTTIEYYHFYSMIFFYFHEDWQKLQDMIKRFRKVFRGRLKNTFISTLQVIKLLKIQAYQNLQTSIPVLQKLASFSHPLANFIIHNQLEYFTRMHRVKYNNCTNESKVSLLRLILSSCQGYIKKTYKGSMQDQFTSLTRQILIQNDICKRHRFLTSQEMKDFRPDKSKQQYLQLQMTNKHEKIYQTAILHSLQTLIALLISNNQINKALELAKFLYRVTHFIWNQQINKQKVLNFIFIYIIQDNDCRNQRKYRQQNRYLYFQYVKILQDDDKEELFIRNFSVFADAVALMYRYRFSEVSGLINRVSKKVLVYSCQRSSKLYLDATRLAFFKIKSQPKYQQNLLDLQTQLSLLENPYNVFSLLQIHMLKGKNITKNNFIRIFAMLRFVNIYAKESVSYLLYPSFMSFYWKALVPRRKMKIIHKTIDYNFVVLSQKQMMKLFVPPYSLKLLSTLENAQKKVKMEKVLKRYGQIIHRRDQTNVTKVKVSYRFLAFYN